MNHSSQTFNCNSPQLESHNEQGLLTAELPTLKRLARITSQATPIVRSRFLDLDTLIDLDLPPAPRLPGALCAEGEYVSLVAPGKFGKTLFMQELAWRAGEGMEFMGYQTDPMDVLYLDRENNQAQILDRLRSLGARKGTFSRLHYASMPTMNPLNTEAGADELRDLVEAARSSLVIIDTVSRFVSGDDPNQPGVWNEMYRQSIVPLKAAGVAVIQLDHTGKDEGRGAAGSYAKTTGVDHVWQGSGEGGDLQLKRTHTRTGEGPDALSITRHGRKDAETEKWAPGSTHHERCGYTGKTVNVKERTEEIIEMTARALCAAGEWEPIPVRTVKAVGGSHGIHIPGSNAVKAAICARHREMCQQASDA